MSDTHLAASGQRLAPGEFFGGARRSCASHGFTISHRIAEGAPDSIATHTHADAHFILVTGGDYVSIAEGRRPDGEATLIYNPPGTTHRDHFDYGRGSFFAVSVSPEVAALALAALEAPAGPCYLTNPLQHSLARAIAGCCAGRADPLSLEALGLELLGSLERNCPRDGPARPGWLLRSREMLDDRFTEDLSIADIARGVGVHPVHLARAFRRHFRCTPGEFARYRRLERAAALLARSRQPLADIALSCGFADQSHLTRAFAHGLGVAPAEYRRLLGGALPAAGCKSTRPEGSRDAQCSHGPDRPE